MAIFIQANIEGIPELKRKFSELTDNLQRKVLFKALIKSTRQLEATMKRCAPKRPAHQTGKSSQYPSRNHPPGHLKASIGTIKSKGIKYPTIWVRPRFRGKYDPWYEHFVIGGTVNQLQDPNPFVDIAWDLEKANVESSLKNDLQRYIQDEINRL